MKLHLLSALFMVGGCITREMIQDAQDRDDDGYAAWQAGGDDCDDSESSANPGEDELCGDGIDNDCNGATDDIGTNAPTWYPDLDRDGFAANAPVKACDAPADHRPSLEAGLDCDDADAAAHPGATEVWYDGVDEDCNGLDDYDRDQDGYRHPSGGGADCNDLDQNVHPDASEVCGNHADDDCDGGHDDCEWSGPLDLEDTRHATLVWSDTGATIVRVSAGNIDEDPTVEVALSAMDRSDIFLFDGPISGVLTTAIHADFHIALADPPNIFGYPVALDGDLDGDGTADLLVANYEDPVDWPAVAAFQSPFHAEMEAADVFRVYNGPDNTTAPNSRFGEISAYIGDLDGDGSYTWWAGQYTPAMCYAVEGVGAGTYLPALATTIVDGCWSLAAAADVDSDGITDVAVGTGTSTLRLLSGSATGAVSATALPAWSPWAGASELRPVGPSADFDDDGTPDLAMTAVNGATAAAGVIFGPVWSGSSPPRFEISLLDSDDFSLALPPVDLNGDGWVDFAALYAAVDTQTGEAPISILVYWGPLTAGTASAAEADATIAMPITQPIFIQASTADIDADGFGDLLVGHLGFAWILYGEGR